MKTYFNLALSLILMIHLGETNAQTEDINSCYEHKSISLPPRDADERNALDFQGTSRAIIILIDETSVLPEPIQQLASRVNENLFKPLLMDSARPGVFYQLLRFSTFSETKFSTTMVKGVLEGGVSMNRQGETKLPGSKVSRLKITLQNLNTCLGQQARFGLSASNKAILDTMKGASSALPRSDILTALQQVGSIFRDRKEIEKTLIVISDMMEHSVYTTFYDKQGDIKEIDSSAEIENIKRKDMIADLKGVKVWVIGGGYFAPPKQGEPARSRNPQKIAALESFWKAYFNLSKAELREFGKPALLGQLP
jgi:hypothetical protein